MSGFELGLAHLDADAFMTTLLRTGCFLFLLGAAIGALLVWWLTGLLA